MHVSRQVARRVIVFNLMVAALVASMGVAVRLRQIHRYGGLVLKMAAEYGVAPGLVAAVIWVESRFDPMRVGKAGEVGLMQVTEGAAEEWAIEHGVPPPAVEDLFDPELNLRIGIWYLARALKRWADRDDPVIYALAEYNAGPTVAARWAAGAANAEDFIERISYPGTRDYVRRVCRRYRRPASLRIKRSRTRGLR